MTTEFVFHVGQDSRIFPTDQAAFPTFFRLVSASVSSDKSGMVGRTFKERVEARLSDLEINPFEAARRGKFERNFVDDILNAKKKSVRGENLTRLVDALETTAPWLLGQTDEGRNAVEEPRRLSDDEQWQEEMEQLGRTGASAYNPDGYRPKVRGAIPEIDVTLGAGEGAVGEMLTLQLGGEAYSGHKIIGEWLFPEEYLRSEINASATKTMVMPVKGDSMEPTYRPGDRVLVDLSQRTITEDTVYVISDGHSAPRIKRLVEVMFSNPRRVKIVSDNVAIDDQEVDLEALTIIGRVVGVVARR